MTSDNICDYLQEREENKNNDKNFVTDSLWSRVLCCSISLIEQVVLPTQRNFVGRPEKPDVVYWWRCGNQRVDNCTIKLTSLRSQVLGANRCLSAIKSIAKKECDTMFITSRNKLSSFLLILVILFAEISLSSLTLYRPDRASFHFLMLLGLLFISRRFGKLHVLFADGQSCPL